VDWSQVEACLEGAVVVTGEGKSPSRETAPGAVLLVGRAGEVLFHKAFGCRSLLPEKSVAEPNTVYDIASLTKAVVTTTLIMKLVEHGKLELDARLSRILQTFGTLGKEQITARQLLAHCSGLSAHETFYKQIAKSDATDKAGILKSRGATEVIYNEIFRMRPENPAGKVTKYSDVGFILLGNLLEVMNGGKQLNRLAVEQVFAPLKLRSTGYIDLTKIRRRGVTPVTDVIAPTNNCPWRKSLICGQVQDENAWAMGGVAAHAGVFSTAQDLHLFATEMLRCYRGESGFVD